jgi:TPP-dependent trihydroxycyclohexane-1,2-dione (THcHDO) dehydratase
MASEKYTVQFRIVDEIRLPEEVDRHSTDIIKQITGYAELNSIKVEHFAKGDDAFKSYSDETVAKTETIVTIHFTADAESVGFDAEDAGQQLYANALKTIKDNPNAKITNSNYREQSPYSLTVIEITAL